MTYNKNKWLLIAILLAPLTTLLFVLLQGSSWVPQVETAGTVALVILVVPICEEVVFRGLLQHELSSYAKLRRTVLGLSWDNIISSALFTLVHVIYYGDSAALLSAVPALLCGLLYSRHQRLIYPIGLHIWYNTNGLLAGAFI
jgi:hypothetical protein